MTDDLVEIKFGLPHYLDATWGQSWDQCYCSRMMSNSDFWKQKTQTAKVDRIGKTSARTGCLRRRSAVNYLTTTPNISILLFYFFDHLNLINSCLRQKVTKPPRRDLAGSNRETSQFWITPTINLIHQCPQRTKIVNIQTLTLSM